MYDKSMPNRGNNGGKGRGPNGTVNRHQALKKEESESREFYEGRNRPRPNVNATARTPGKAREPVAVGDNKKDKFQEYAELRKKLQEKRQALAPAPKKKIERKPKAKKAKKENIKIAIPPFVTVSNLAFLMNVKLSSLILRLGEMGFENMTHDYILDKENAALIADEFGFDVNIGDESEMDLFPAPRDETKLKPRPPVVTIMGHVDHGKTTILDYLRKSAIASGEFGGITQHIGAFSFVTPHSKKKITFLDTPGHAAFLSMRERGAIVTDIIILVVAGDDSVMPQTIEAIKHAKKSGVPLIVAINKCDKPGVKIDKVLGDLARYDVDIEDYGGDTQTVQVSGKTGLNMDKLEEAVITLSELSDFQAEQTGISADGWVLESQVAKGLGNIATVLVRRGTVKPGLYLVAGNTYCKVRGMKDEHGKTVKAAGPSTPVQVWGWKELPLSGSQIIEADNEAVCKKVLKNREAREKQIQAAKDVELINEKRVQQVKELERQEKINELKLQGLDASQFVEEETHATVVKYIVKSDVYGSAEAIKESIDGLGNDEVRATVISHDAGEPTESELEMASALDAQVLCFNIKVPKAIKAKAERMGVAVHEENVIYRLIESVTAELTLRLKPLIETKVTAEAEIRDVFQITGKNKVLYKIAGCKVTSGVIKLSLKVRVRRGSEVVFSGTMSSLKHVKKDISEATKGFECGMSFEKWDKFEAGDVVESYEETEVPRYL